ncbi:MAG: transketolase [Alphaproteobacteria bacterium]
MQKIINPTAIETMPLLASAVRALSVAMVERAQSGHPGLPLGAADVASVLFARHLFYSPENPDDIFRDRFILSAGHGSAMLYSILHLLGYQGFPLSVLQKFRSLNSITAGHPEYHITAGIETTTGPLGQGLANGVGMALGLKKIFNTAPAPKVYVLLGDGCLMEGISEEAISFAGHLELDNLILLFDDNHVSIDGNTNLATRTDQVARLSANGFHTISVDGHDVVAIDKSLAEAKTINKPKLIACRTTIGKGAPSKQGTAAVHGAALGKDEAMIVLKNLNIPDAEKFLDDFILPPAWVDAWHQLAKNKTALYAEKKHALIKQYPTIKKPDNHINHFSQPLKVDIKNYKLTTIKEKKSIATRVASQQVISIFCKFLPQLIGGSADLTGSNGTKINEQTIINKDNFGGQYIHYGVREHGMAAMMNGLALIGFIPYGGTFLVFSDYMRGGLRLSAVMKQKVIYVLTHDSIGVGEDGPTHQPIEHLAALRAIPHLLVLRPCDAIETIESWQIALTHQQPSVLALSRQNLPVLRYDKDVDDNKTAMGGYIIYGAEKQRSLTFLASGSEVCLAIEAAQDLEKNGKRVAVVSIPCFELFRQQTATWRSHILGDAPIIAIEAAAKQPWHEWLRHGDEFIGLDDFGASAPYKDIYHQRGLYKENILKIAGKLL